MTSEVRPEYPLTVFYDGNCPVCSWEMDCYRRRGYAGKLNFVDISQPDFDPVPYGRSRQEFVALMHAMDAKGRFFVGVEAFRAMWRSMPGGFYPFLATLVSLPGIYPLAKMGYHLFARVRRYLPHARS